MLPLLLAGGIAQDSIWGHNQNKYKFSITGNSLFLLHDRIVVC